MNVLLNRINAPGMLNIQAVQNQEAIYMTDTVPAAGYKLQKLNISNQGAFYVQRIHLSYTTKEDIGAGIVDTGIDYFRGKLSDGASMKALMNDFVPFHLWAVPGRIKSLPALGSDSFQNQIVFTWEYMFTINSDIVMEVKNDATLSPNTWHMLFVGIRVRSAATNAGL